MAVCLYQHRNRVLGKRGPRASDPICPRGLQRTWVSLAPPTPDPNPQTPSRAPASCPCPSSPTYRVPPWVTDVHHVSLSLSHTHAHPSPPMALAFSLSVEDHASSLNALLQQIWTGSDKLSVYGLVPRDSSYSD